MNDFSKGRQKVYTDFKQARSQDASRNFGMYQATVEDAHDPLGEGKLIVSIPGMSNTGVDAGQALEDSDSKKFALFSAYPMMPSAGTNILRGAEEFGCIGYGIWGPQPRRGDTVVVAFLQNAKQSLVWLGCIPRKLTGFMVPGVPTALMEDGSLMPGMEVVEKSMEDTIRPPALDFADNLVTAGLHEDGTRGAGDSGKTRESPSMVSGWKTPGDPENGQIGHQLVFDDRLESQGVRLRTSFGNQILISDINRSIYISTAHGDSWVEIHNDGKIDVYGKDSISIHAEGNLNLRAGKNLNMDVGGDLNIKAGGAMNSYLNSFNQLVEENSKTAVKGDMHVHVTGDAYFQSLANMSLNSGEVLTIGSAGMMNLKSSGATINMDGASDVRINEQLAASPDEAEQAPMLGTSEILGPPTDDQIRNSEAGSNKPYVTGMRVPQHEPWKIEGRFIRKPIETPGHLQDRFTGPTETSKDQIRKKTRLGSNGKISDIPPDDIRPPPYPPGAWREEIGADVASPGNRTRTEYIIIHHSADEPQSNTTIGNIWRSHTAGNGWADIGYHYVIERDGTLQIGRPENQIGAHAGADTGVNSISVGVSLIGGAKPNTRLMQGEINFTAAQWPTLKQIVTELMQRYPNAKVLGHSDIAPRRKIDVLFDVETWVAQGMPALSSWPTKVLPSWPA